MTDPKQTAPASEDDAAIADGLVKMTKDGEISYVHPTTVPAHEAVGWRVA